MSVAWREVLEFLLPARCLGCDDRLPLGADELVCGPCLSRLREPPWPRCARCGFPSGTGREAGSCLACRDWPEALGSAHAAVILEPPAERLVHGLKYGGWRELAPLMARRMHRAAPPEEAGAVVVPVPTTARRRRQRGYNQAALLALEYAGLARIECLDALERRAAGGSQVALAPSQRRSNVRDAFQVREALLPRLRGRPVLLLDDVLTTGATAAEAALELERAGALGVRLITFARALPDRRRETGAGGPT